MRRQQVISIIVIVVIVGGIVIWRAAWRQEILGRLSFYASQPVYYGYQTGSRLGQGSGGLGGEDNSSARAPLVEQSELERLRLENEQLRRELSLLPKEELVTVGAEIIGKRQDETGLTFLLNRGLDHHIKPGYPVLSGGALIGLVVRAESLTAEMILINSPLFVSAVEVLNDQASRGLAEGEFNLATTIKLLPADEDVKPGQLVVTSGLDELIPKGIVLGTIAAVDREEGGLFQEAVVISPVNLSKLRILQVVVK